MLDVRRLGLLRAQKFPARRQIEKELPDLDVCAGRAAGGLDLDDFSAVDDDLRALRRITIPFARRQGEAADAGDAGEGFAAKTHRGDGRQILRALNFARGMAFEAEQRVVPAHAGAVIGHPHQAAATGLDLDGDRAPPARRARFRPAPSRRWQGVRPLRRRRSGWQRVREAGGCDSCAVKRETENVICKVRAHSKSRITSH